MDETLDSYVTDVQLSVGDNVAVSPEGSETVIPTFYMIKTYMSDNNLRGVVFTEDSLYKLYNVLDQVFGERKRIARIATQN